MSDPPAVVRLNQISDKTQPQSPIIAFGDTSNSVYFIDVTSDQSSLTAMKASHRSGTKIPSRDWTRDRGDFVIYPSGRAMPRYVSYERYK